VDLTFRSRKFAVAARRILEVKEGALWRQWGYASFGVWGKEEVGARDTAYLYAKIAKHLGFLPIKVLESIGVYKCRDLCRLARNGIEITQQWVAQARSLSAADFQVQVDRELRKAGIAEQFGAYLEPPFRGLQHAPIGEQGVVFLFGLVSRDLKFRVERIDRKYPDCIAKRQVSSKPERWETVRIEFEYRSSSFKKHDPGGSDFVVCWEHDWPDCPLPVIELKSEIEKLSRD